MSSNINQIFIANPIVTNNSTDLMYFGRSPYGIGDDVAMTYANFAAQFSAGTVTPQNIQQNSFNYAIDSSVVADTITVAFTPPYAAITDGMSVFVKVANTNTTTTPTLNVDGLGAANIVSNKGTLVNPGDMIGPDGIYQFIYSSGAGAYVLMNPATSGIVPQAAGSFGFNFGNDGGAVNAYTLNLQTNPRATATNPGTTVYMIPANTNTGASTLDLNGFGAQGIVKKGVAGPVALVAGDMVAGCPALLASDSSVWFLLNPA